MLPEKKESNPRRRVRLKTERHPSSPRSDIEDRDAVKTLLHKQLLLSLTQNIPQWLRILKSSPDLNFYFQLLLIHLFIYLIWRQSNSPFLTRAKQLQQIFWMNSFNSNVNENPSQQLHLPSDPLEFLSADTLHYLLFLLLAVISVLQAIRCKLSHKRQSWASILRTLVLHLLERPARLNDAKLK